MFDSVEMMSIKHAMDEYAKQQCVEFAEWLNYEGYRSCDKVFATWENDADIDIEFTTEELYQLFLTTQSKQQ